MKGWVDDGFGWMEGWMDLMDGRTDGLEGGDGLSAAGICPLCHLSDLDYSFHTHCQPALPHEDGEQLGGCSSPSGMQQDPQIRLWGWGQPLSSRPEQLEP